MSAKQKLVTIFLYDNFSGKKGSSGQEDTGPFSGAKEHMGEIREQGWAI